MGQEMTSIRLPRVPLRMTSTAYAMVRHTNTIEPFLAKQRIGRRSYLLTC
jgi:hypothetical protein